MSNYVPGRGAATAKLVVVGEAPGRYESEAKEPFVGPSGLLLNKMLRDAGVERDDVYVTNVYKYQPPFNDIKRIGEVIADPVAHREQLWEEIWAIKPNCILALGNTALWALTGKSGINNWRGSILPALKAGWKVVPTLHPAALLHMESEEESGVRSQSAQVYMQFDVKRAVEQSAFPDIRRTERILEVARSSADVWRFIQDYRAKGKRHVSVDIEVIHCIPVCVALAFNGWHAMSIPLMPMDYARGWDRIAMPVTELSVCWRMIAELLADPEICVIGQNFKFDWDKLEQVCGIKIGNLWVDIGLLMHSLYPELPKSQAFMTSIFTDEPYYKDEGKEFNIKKDDVHQLLLYNAKDAAVAYEIAYVLMQEAKEIGATIPGFTDWRQEFFLDYVMKLPRLYMDIEHEGLILNKAKQKVVIEKFRIKIEFMKKKLNELVGFEVNANAPQQVAALIYTHLKMPQRKGVAEANLVALHANNCNGKDGDYKREVIDLILQIRAHTKQLGTYFRVRADYDGKVRTNYNVAGTVTGRSSTKKLKAPVRPHPMGTAFQTMTKHGDIGQEVREMYDCDEGYVFVEVDLSQAEARLVALLGESQETLQLFDSGTDVHKLTGSWIFQMPVEQITKELRFVGKTVRHAGNYDLGDKRLMELVNTKAKKFNIDIRISQYRAKRILELFHQHSPWIRDVFHESVVDALASNNRVLINPYGRRRQFFGDWGRELWKEAYAQIPQSTVADHLKHAMLRIRDRIPGARIAIDAHDAFVAKVPKAEIDSHLIVFREELEIPIDFQYCTLSRGRIVIPCEAKVGDNYRYLKDYAIPRAA